MTGNSEPGFLDLLESLMGGDDPKAYQCSACNNSKAVVMAVCPCGWKFQGCMACLMIDASRNVFAVADSFKHHKAECPDLARLVRIAEAAQ